DGLQYLVGKLPGYPGVDPSILSSFSASDILESMDTVVVDDVRARRGDAGVAALESAIARSVLDSVVDLYGNKTVLIALDAGHGGNCSYFCDPGSEGTEAIYARQVANMIVNLSDQPAYLNIYVRRIWNDGISDDFGASSSRRVTTLDQ